MTIRHRTDIRSERVHLSARILSGSALALSLVLTACGGGGGSSSSGSGGGSSGGSGTTPTAIVNQWTWEGGSSTANAQGTYGTLGTAASGNIPGARAGSATWTDGRGNFWLFGGVGYDVNDTSGELNDLWKFDPATGAWTWEEGSNTYGASGTYGTLGTAAPGNIPGARTGSATWTDGSGNVWLFGGVGYGSASAFGELNDLWKYNLATGAWTWEGGTGTADAIGTYGTLGTAAPGNIPGGRDSAAAWTDGSGNVWLFGGEGYDSAGHGAGSLNSLWKYNLTTSEWTWEGGSSLEDAKGTYGTLGTAAPSNIPGARFGSATWTDASGNFWLFGGWGYDVNGTQGRLNDLWKFNPATSEWTWEGGPNTANVKGTYGTLGTAAPGNIPGARNSAVAWTDASGNVWLFGGEGYDSAGTNGDLNDLWMYHFSATDPAASAWTWEGGPNTANVKGTYGTLGTAAPGNLPGGRGGSATWTDGSGNVWLFGGYGYDVNGTEGPLNDLWKYQP